MKNELGLIGNNCNLAWMERGSTAFRWLPLHHPAAAAETIPLPRPEAQEKLRSYFHYVGASQVLETVYSSAELVFRQIDFFPYEGPWQGYWLRLLEPMKGAIPLHLRWPAAVLQAKNSARAGQPLALPAFHLLCSQPWPDLLAQEVLSLKTPLALAVAPAGTTLPQAPFQATLAFDLFRDTEKRWKTLPLPQAAKKRVPDLILRSCQVVRLVGSYLAGERTPAYLDEPVPLPDLPPLAEEGLDASIREMALALEGCGDGELPPLLEVRPVDDPATLAEDQARLRQLLENGFGDPLPDDHTLAGWLQQLGRIWNRARLPEINDLLGRLPWPTRSDAQLEQACSPYLCTAHALGQLIEAGLCPWNDEQWENAKTWLEQNGAIRGQPQSQEIAGEVKTVRPLYRRVRQELALSRLAHFRVMPWSVKNFLEEAARLASPLGLLPTYLGPEKEAFGLFPDPRAHARLLLTWLEGTARLAEAAPPEEIL